MMTKDFLLDYYGTADAEDSRCYYDADDRAYEPWYEDEHKDVELESFDISSKEKTEIVLRFGEDMDMYKVLDTKGVVSSIIKMSGLKKGYIADRLKISTSSLSKRLNGETKFTVIELSLIEMILNLNQGVLVKKISEV